MIKETVKEVKKDFYKKGYVNIQDTSVNTNKKAKARYRIEHEVFDLEDSVADNAKMISLLMSLLYRIYNIIPESEKSALIAEDRYLIDTTFTEFMKIQTRADIQFQTEGMQMIIKIIERQGKIGKIISGE